MTDSSATEVDIVVIGGGVVGLASAGALARDGRSVCLLERSPRFGQGASTHNSGVIHAGIYYPATSLKARLCVEGRHRLYHYCATHDIPHRQTGKLIVPPTDDTSALEILRQRAAANGVTLELLDGARVRDIQPGLDDVPALWSPGTGIVDVDAYVVALAGDARRDGAVLLASTPLVGADVTASGGFMLTTPRERIAARLVVNAAGLFADDVSRALGGESFRIWPCRGDYAEFRRSVRQQIHVPIYPLPDPTGHGLGVHITPTTAGSVLLGPTIRYVEDKGDFESGRLTLDDFLTAARRLLPGLRAGDLVEGGAGMRAKFHPPEESFADFVIRADREREGLIHAAGIDSPGLTASLAIAHEVARIVEDARL
ncbi:MAG: NAD(P)/FAD-dependent oxidoreductase [Acidobacteriota bacterium]|nr:NAD(P)/FAD-dependent oxidoreductase [Acidobacteriota bacterium]